MVKPRILISASASGWINYENALWRAGCEPVGGYCPGVDLSFDGLLLAGGADMDPTLFGQENRGSQGIDPARDAAELALALAFLSAGKPILGICRGHQVLNVALGGTLIQDLGPEQNLFHLRRGRDQVHPVRTAPGSLLHRLYGPVFAVNSAHHQAVDRLGTGLVPTAWSESGLVEAMALETAPVLGVQFHPERMAYARRRPDTADGSFIFDWFLRQCSSGKVAPIQGI